MSINLKHRNILISLLIILFISLCVGVGVTLNSNKNTITASAEADTSGLSYTLYSDDTYAVSGYSGSSTSVVIPDNYNSKAVTRIEAGAFKYNTKIQNVVIGNNVTYIGGQAFSYCTYLSSISLGNNVIEINMSFESCTSLTSITIPSSVTTIASTAFNGCKNLKSVTFENTSGWQVTKDNNTTSLSSSDLANSSTAATYLRSTYVSYTWRNINNQGEGSLKFALSSDKTYYLVSGIGTYTDTDVIIPTEYNGLPVKGISWGCFMGNTSITSVTIPDSINEIKNYAFANCTALKEIVVDSANTTYKSINGDLYSYDETELIQYAIGKTASEIEILESVTVIGGYAIAGCSKLQVLTIAGQITKIGEYAFADCSNLIYINIIPSSVTYIGNYAFDGCSSLSVVSFENTSTWTVSWSWVDVVYVGNDENDNEIYENQTVTTSYELSYSDIQNSTTAATYLKNTYCKYVWEWSAPADTTAPTALLYVDGGFPVTSGVWTCGYRMCYNAEIVASDDSSGVARIYYRYTSGTSDPTGDWNYTTDSSWNFNGSWIASSMIFQFYVEDNAGNTSGYYYIKYEIQLPFITLYKADGTKITDNSTVSATNSTIDGGAVSTSYIYATVSDTISGGASFKYSTDNSTWYTYTDSTHLSTNSYYYFQAYDNAGNGSGTIKVILDTVKPTISGAATSSTGVYTNSNFTVKTADNLSGVVAFYYKLSTASSYTTSSNASTVTIQASATDGLYMFYCKDAAGNTSLTYYVNLDTVRPTISGASTSSTGIYTKESFTITTADSYSGVAALYYKLSTAESYTTSSNANTLTIQSTMSDGLYMFYCKDKAGNLSYIYYVNLDTTVPTILLYAEATEIQSGDSTNASYICAAGEDGGALSYMQFSTDNSTWLSYTSGTKIKYEGTFYFKAYDVAGNVSDIYYIILDYTNPVGSTYNVEGTSLDNGTSINEAVYYLAEDALSGLSYTEYSYEGGNWTLYTGLYIDTNFDDGYYAFRAVDYAGNVSDIYYITVHTHHIYESVATDPTCTEQGYTTYTCTKCGETYIDDYTEATGHTYTMNPTVLPTCTTDGYTSYTCDDCGDTYIDTTYPAYGHDWVETDYLAATHETEGYRVYTCSHCGETYTETIAVLPHTYVIVSEIVNDDGTITRVYACTEDGETYEETVIDKNTVAQSIIELFENYQGYLWLGIAAVTVLWAFALGIMIMIARKKEEQEKARKLVKVFISGLIAIAVILVAVPYIIYGICLLL